MMWDFIGTIVTFIIATILEGWSVRDPDSPSEKYLAEVEAEAAARAAALKAWRSNRG